jgi:hypothetical protein
MNSGSAIARAFAHSAAAASAVAIRRDNIAPLPPSPLLDVEDRDRPHEAQEIIYDISDDDSTPNHGNPTSRSLQQVLGPAKKKVIAEWMVAEVKRAGSDKHIISKAVKNFPHWFRGCEKANLQKSSRIWKEKEVWTEFKGRKSISVKDKQGRSRVTFKVARRGRGRKREDWVLWLHKELHEDWQRLRKAGVQFSLPVLQAHAKNILRKSEHPEYHADMIHEKSGKKLVEKITLSWIQSFCDANGIVVRSKTGKLSVSPEKREFIDRSCVYHLGIVKRAFENGDLKEEMVENWDETHFVINLDNGKTLGLIGEKSIKYADVVSGGEGMTMLVRITGGPSACIQPPLMIFQNSNRSYPIRGVPDDVPGVCYRTQPKGWMDMQLFREVVQEERFVKSDSLGRRRVIYIDNATSHNMNESLENIMEKLKFQIRYLEANTTDLCQPADSFVIKQIKQAWTNSWNEKKIQLIDDHQWQNEKRKNKEWSGKLKNPGKHYFLELARDSVREANKMLDKNGLNSARKSMIRCGLSLDVDGVWKVSQLLPNLQELIRKYPENFNGQNPEEVSDEKKNDVKENSSDNESEAEHILSAENFNGHNPEEVSDENDDGKEKSSDNESTDSEAEHILSAKRYRQEMGWITESSESEEADDKDFIMMS